MEYIGIQRNRNAILYTANYRVNDVSLDLHPGGFRSEVTLVEAPSNLWREHEAPSFPYTAHLVRETDPLTKGPAGHSQMRRLPSRFTKPERSRLWCNTVLSAGFQTSSPPGWFLG